MGKDKNSKNMNKKILIIEDDKDIARLISYNLGKDGFEIVEAYDGESGLSLADAERPDLIILDLMLPEIDGYGVLNILKKNRSNKHIPVIIISAKVSPGAIIKGFQSGAIDYMPKPFSVGELTFKVRNILSEPHPRKEVSN